jgi:S1-C subfamily serine protease
MAILFSEGFKPYLYGVCRRALLLFFLSRMALQGQDVPNLNIYTRVLQIQASVSSGSAFTIEVDKRQYLVTARHVLVGTKPDDTIKLKNGAKWETIPAKFIDCPTNADIAVLVAPRQLTLTFTAPPSSVGVLVGQDVFFMGFPYGLHSSMQSFNVAFVKKGILSSMITDTDGISTIYIDGHNNPGFSGGPMVFKNSSDNEWHIAGVVSGFLWATNPIVNGTGTNSFVQDNTGIVVGVDIRTAVDAIRKNPIGPLVAQ